MAYIQTKTFNSYLLRNIKYYLTSSWFNKYQNLLSDPTGQRSCQKCREASSGMSWEKSWIKLVTDTCDSSLPSGCGQHRSALHWDTSNGSVILG